MNEQANVKTRADALYEYMLGRDGWTKQRDVYNALRGLYPPAGSGDFHASSARRKMSEDIRIINESERYEKIIIHGDEGVKIASDEEAALYVRSRENEAKRQLRQVGVLRDKIGGAKVRMEV